MERSRNFYKTIRLGYILISVLIGCIAYNSFYEWQEIEALELDNKKIDEFRKEINNINIQMIKFSLFGETILEWNDKDIEHYHAQRMAMDSMLCRFKATYPAERIDSVRHLLEDKERQMCQIVQILEQQQAINDKITRQVPVIAQKSVQEQPKKPKRKGFLGIFGKKEEAKPTVTTTMYRSFNRNMRTEQSDCCCIEFFLEVFKTFVEMPPHIISVFILTQSEHVTDNKVILETAEHTVHCHTPCMVMLDIFIVPFQYCFTQ